ncbi:MAG: CoA transferase [Alphaproteobacteria bacterium]|nr:CoA transferase [Alphaproteobacteria bacterium]
MTDDPPFEGVRVLDLSQGIAGPYCGMMLARNGADVIKLEPTGTGCWSRQLGKATGDHTAHSLIVHRGKRSLSLDLKSPEGCAIARRLAADCDVLIQNYRVGKIDRFGLDYDTVRQANEAIVYLSITGFGSSGPNADLPATDSVMQAYTGLMSINRDATGMPQRLNMLAIDFACGLYGFQAVSSALYRKAMKGKGAHIQTSLLEASLSYQEAAIIESALQGAEVEPIGMPVGTFKTSDGYMSINARRQPQFERFARLLGHEEWIADPRFVEPRARVANREALLVLLRPIIETKTTDAWCALLSEIDVLHGRVHTHGDLFEDAQVKAISALRWVEDPTLGTLPMASLPGQPTPMTGDRFTLSPRLGEHTREILAELGHEAAAIEAMIAGGAAQAAD